MIATLAHTHRLLADVDSHLRQASEALRSPCGHPHTAELRAQVDGLLDYRLVLMAARDHLTPRTQRSDLSPKLR